MIEARLGCVAAVVDGQIYVIGGMGGRRKVEAYDPAKTPGQGRPTCRVLTALASASVVDGLIYVIGGSRERFGSQQVRLRVGIRSGR